MKKLSPLAGLALLLAVAPRAGAAAEALATHAQWLKLLHYQADGSSPSGWRSTVLSPEFFLAPDGATNPGHELAATLQALAAPAAGEADAHAQCRFPARDLWLRRALDRDDTWPRQPCAKFRRWSADESTQAISLVFATGYLANPASYYGHILLKFNAPKSAKVSDLLDVSVNYGAIVPDGVDAVSYILNGVLGGYDGGFSHIEYYFHSHNYSENEHRDLWEYELDLAPHEVRLLTAHAWEILGKKFRYFFFRENCAYRMAELLEIIDGVDIMPARPWTIPQSVMRKVADVSRDGRPLLSRVTYRPSRQSRFHDRYLRLDGAGRHAVGRAVASADYLGTPEFQALGPAARTAVADTLIDYFEFRYGGPKAAADRATAPGYAAALAARFQLPPETTPHAVPAPPAPHSGRRPGWLSGGAVRNAELGTGAAVQWRGAYYDALDGDGPHLAHSALTMLDTRLAFYRGEARLERLDFINVESVQAAVSRLPGDEGKAWSVTAGLVQQYAGCPEDCLMLRFDGAMGRSLRLGRSLLAGAQIGGALHDNVNGEGIATGRGDVFADVTLGRRLRARLRYRHRIEVDGEVIKPESVQMQARLQLDANADLRLEFDHDVVDQTRLTLGWYW